MDIKLNARLAAYSKVDSFGSSILPDPDSSNEGDILGVNSDGDYMLMDCVTKEAIDTLFSGEITEPVSVKKDTIDTLFELEDAEVVSKKAIDSLFD